MALTKINNNTLSAVTTLPSAIATGKVLQVVQHQVQQRKNYILQHLTQI